MIVELRDMLIVLDSALECLLSPHWHNAKDWRHAKNGYTQCKNTIVTTMVYDVVVTLL